ncbi:MAG: hypothetical protein WCT26_01645 [Candidatus Buchananbacteria bacterium]|jgi:hypothetical protein
MDEQETRKPFPETFKHNAFLDELKNERFHGTNIPDFFRQHNSFELRKIMIDMFSRSSDTFQIHSDAQADWEELLTFLMKESEGRYGEGNYDGGNLFLDVLSAYIFKADTLLIIPAMRFAINSIGEKYGHFRRNDNEIVKLLCGYINKGYIKLDLTHHSPEIRELSKTFCLEGWFGALPEIKPIIQMMLNELFDFGSIIHQSEDLKIRYDQSGFVQVRRAIDIILRERHYNTDFLSFVEKMAILHKEKLKTSRAGINFSSNMDRDRNPLLFYPTNQAILDETVRLLRQAQKDNIKNGATRRQEILDLIDR